MRRHNRNQTDPLIRDVWREIQNITASGHDTSRVFDDWLELMLSAFLSYSDNTARGSNDPAKFDGRYEARYIEIVDRYKSNRVRGERPADYFSAAAGKLMAKIEETGEDVLGTLFEDQISFGEKGQYFTPEPICALMTSLTPALPGASVADPAGCGSGRMLLAAAKVQPSIKLYGTDVDRRCAIMATLNMIFFGHTAVITWGNGLSNTWHNRWLISGGLVAEVTNT